MRQVGSAARGAGTDCVARCAQHQGLVGVPRPDRHRRCPELTQELLGRQREQHHRRHVIGDLRRHGCGHRLDRDTVGHLGRRHEPGDHGALGVTAQDDPGIRAGGGDGLHVVGRVTDAVHHGARERSAVAEVVAGRVVHRIDADGAARRLGAHSIDESLADTAHAGRLAGTSGEHHVHIGAGLRTGRRGDPAHHRRGHTEHRGGCGAGQSSNFHADACTPAPERVTAQRGLR